MGDTEKEELDVILERVVEIMEGLRQASRPFIPGTSSIRYAGPTLDREDARALLEGVITAYTTGWFGLGQHAQAFEEALARWLGVEECVFTNSGSSANLLAIASLSSEGLLRPGDEVITPALTFPTVVNPLLMYGLKPVLIDSVLPTLTLNLEELERATSNKTKAILVPHLNGNPSDMRGILNYAVARGLYVIEDACDALGAKYDGQYVGTFGQLGTCSFYVAHHMTTGEGGAVFGNDKNLTQAARSLRDWGRALASDNQGPGQLRSLQYQTVSQELPVDYELRYTYTRIGFNLKPLDFQAALGLAQLRKLPQIIEARKRNFDLLFAGLSPYQDSLMLPQALPLADPSWFSFPMVIRADAPFSRKDLTQHLESHRIETRPILAGNILKQPAYKNTPMEAKSDLKNTDLVLDNGLFIGVYPGIGDQEVAYILDVFSQFLRR